MSRVCHLSVTDPPSAFLPVRAVDSSSISSSHLPFQSSCIFSVVETWASLRDLETLRPVFHRAGFAHTPEFIGAVCVRTGEDTISHEFPQSGLN